MSISQMKTKLHKENPKTWKNDTMLAEIRKLSTPQILNTKGNKGFSPFCMAVIFYLNAKCKK